MNLTELPSKGLRVGLLTPIVSLPASGFSDWERNGSLEQLKEVAQAADKLGYNHLTCSMHAAIPRKTVDAGLRGSRFWDPLVTLSCLASITTKIRLLVYVAVLGYQHPVELSKSYGTLDLVSSSRLTLGLGVGSLEEEFQLLGVPFVDRGERADDALAALHACMGETQPSYHGAHYSFDGFVIDPYLGKDVPIWIGGRTRRSLKRALRFGDGWVPFALSPSQIQDMLESTDEGASLRRPSGFDIALSLEEIPDPIEHPGEAVSTIHRAVSVGATCMSVRLRGRSFSHYLEQLSALAELLEFNTASSIRGSDECEAQKAQVNTRGRER